MSSDKTSDFLDLLSKNAMQYGYFINPDRDFAMELAHSLLINQERYGYLACPCRLATAEKQKDLDIICPCDYRDADIIEFGACYCGLYVSEKIFKGEAKLKPIPERRKALSNETTLTQEITPSKKTSSHPIWRCNVCGYLCAREEAPEICPICKAKHERFELFLLG